MVDEWIHGDGEVPMRSRHGWHGQALLTTLLLALACMTFPSVVWAEELAASGEERPQAVAEHGSLPSEDDSVVAPEGDGYVPADDQQPEEQPGDDQQPADDGQPAEMAPDEQAPADEQPQADDSVDVPEQPEEQLQDEGDCGDAPDNQEILPSEPVAEAAGEEAVQADDEPQETDGAALVTLATDSAGESDGAPLVTLAAAPTSAKKQLVPNGTYIIRTGLGSQLVLDTEGTKKEKRANVIEADYKGGVSQAWKISYDSTRELYQIFRTAADGSKLCLDVAGGKAQNDANVQLWTKNGSDAQWWDIIKDGSGFNIVSALKKSLVLDVAKGKAADGTNVWLHTDNGSTAQRFFFYATNPAVAKSAQVVKDGTYEIVCTISGGTSNVADIASGSLANGANLQMHTRNSSIAQRFHFAYNAQGYYDVVAVGSGRSVSAKGSGILPGTNVLQATSAGKKAQQWVVRRNGNGTYSLINRASGLALSITGSSTKSGANLKLATAGKGAWQQFKLRSVDMLPTGIFTIKALSSTGQVVDIKGGSAASGAAAQMHSANGTMAQKFELKRVAANEYRIRTAASGGWLTATKSGATVTQQGNHATAKSNSNTWRAEWVNGHFVLVNKATGAALTMSGGKTANGTKVTTTKTSGGKSQQFTIAPANLLDAGCYFIASLKGPYLDISGDSADSGANVEVNARDGSLGQYYYLQRSGSTYRIKNAYSGKYVGAVGTSNDANVTQQPSSSSDAQKWRARIADGGGVMFVNVATSNLTLDIAGGKTANGTNVRVHKANNTQAQAWKLIKTTYNPYPDYVLRAIQKANASSSSTRYLIVVDRGNTHTIVLTGGNGNWKPYKNFLCTVGKSSTPTVSGSFSVGSRGYSFGSGYTCYYWTQFYADYLFHSVLYNQGTRTIQDGRLGAHASHGCVRLAIDNAHWIYSNVPSGTRVLVY